MLRSQLPPRREVHALARQGLDLVNRHEPTPHTLDPYMPYGGLETAYAEYGIGKTTVRVGTLEDRDPALEHPRFHIVVTQPPVHNRLRGFIASETGYTFRHGGTLRRLYKVDRIDEGLLLFDDQNNLIRTVKAADLARNDLRIGSRVLLESPPVFDKERAVKLAKLVFACTDETLLPRNHERMTRYNAKRIRNKQAGN